MPAPAKRAPRKTPSGSHRPRVLLLLAWYATEVFRGIARVAQQAGWIMDSGFERSGTIPNHWQGDGVICVLGVHDAVDRYAAGCRVPVVNVGYSRPDAAPRVAADQTAIAELAVGHFAARGFQHFAYYLRSGLPGDLGRWHAYRAALAAAGKSAALIDGSAARLGDTASQLRWLARQLRELPKPLAVLAEIDDYAIEVVEAAVEAAIAVPEDLAVLGVGNDELRCPFASVPLSSVDDNPRGIGEAAALLLERLMRGQRPPKEPVHVAPVRVVTRRSTDVLAVEHPLVARALREIRDHFREPITAEGIVAGIPMSRRRLHDAFLRYIGRSVADEVARLRINQAKRLLAETDQKHHDIARSCGYRSEARLSVVFRRETGMTPGQYRARFNPDFLRRRKIGRPAAD